MPDSDNIRRGLFRRYNTPYKQLCESVADPADIAMAFVRSAVRFYTGKPAFANLAVGLYDLLRNHRGPWEQLYAKRDQLCRNALVSGSLDKRTMNLVKTAFNLCAQESRNARVPLKQSALACAIAERIVTCDIIAPISSAHEPHFADADAGKVCERLAEIRRTIEIELRKPLARIIEGQNSTGIRIPSGRPKQTISADTDLMTIIRPMVNAQPELPLQSGS